MREKERTRKREREKRKRKRQGRGNEEEREGRLIERLHTIMLCGVLRRLQNTHAQPQQMSTPPCICAPFLESPEGDGEERKGVKEGAHS